MMPSSARAAALCLLALVACSRSPRAGAPAMPSPQGEPHNGLEVVGWMRFSHPSRELHSLAFTLTTTCAPDTTSTDATVYALLPGAMRVDAPRTSLVRDGYRAALFRGRDRVATMRGVDLHQLLAFDVFAEGVDTTIMWLDSARVRFGLAREDRFNGRRAWVVGALEGDDTSSQFWVDADHWRLLRLIQRESPSPELLTEVRYTSYTELLDTPVPTRIEIWRNGRLVEEETLSGFVVNPDIPRRAFDVARLRSVGSRALTPSRP